MQRDNQVFVRNMCTLADAAERLAMPAFRLARWAERRKVTGFPEPMYQYKMTTIYHFPDIEQWIKLWYSTRRGN